MTVYDHIYDCIYRVILHERTLVEKTLKEGTW